MMGGEDTISREAARQIAEEYLAENQVSRATGEVGRVMAWDEIEGRKPLTYTPTEDFWSTHWGVYLRQEGLALRESLIMAIHREMCRRRSSVGRAYGEVLSVMGKFFPTRSATPRLPRRRSVS